MNPELAEITLSPTDTGANPGGTGGRSHPVVASYCTTFLKPEMRHIYRQVTSLRRFRTFVICRHRQGAEQYPFKDLTILQKPRKNFLSRFWLKYIRRQPPIIYRGEMKQLLDALQAGGADLMHIYFGHTGVHLLPFIKLWDRPAIVSFHGADIMTREHQPGYEDSLRELVQTVPLVLARSRSLQDRLMELGCPKDKLRLNRTGIPLDHFPRVDRQPPPDGAWQIVQACRLIAKKGIPTALRAFAQFRDRFPRARFIIAGEGPMEEQIRGQIAEMGLQGSVELRGFLDQENLYKLFADSHLFLHPSEMTQDANQEGVPNSMLEAMSTGMPVVATLHGGIPEAVENRRTGLLRAERDADGLAEALFSLADDPDRWQSMGKAASASISENFEHRRQVEKLEECYAEALLRHTVRQRKEERVSR